MPVTGFTPETFVISHPSHLQDLSHVSLHLTGTTTKSVSRGTLAVKVRLERNLVTFLSLKGILKQRTIQNLHNFQTVSDCLRWQYFVYI